MSAEVELKSITKIYGSVVALDHFSHTFKAGKIHALMGKNGCGKSTLVKLMSGVIQPNEGSILINGKETNFHSPSDAFAANVVTVHQELSLVRELSVTENVYLGRLPEKNILGVSYINWTLAHQQTKALLSKMGLDIDPDTEVSSLSVGQQQTIEIAKAMSFNPSLLLLDEPTSALASKEVEMLFTLLRNLKEQGVTMMYISHRMSELAEIADTVTVLRDGKLIGCVEMAESSNDEIISMMFGDVAHATRPARTLSAEKLPILEVRNLSSANRFKDISFDLHHGEILGIAGMLGAGRSELMRAIFGADQFDSGEITFEGIKLEEFNPRSMTAMGIGFTSENRKEEGLVQAHSIHDNLTMASLRKNSPYGIVSRATESTAVAKQFADLHIKAGNAEDPVSSLSGGNQQKVVIGNWLNISPKIMFFDEPSRGVDVRAKEQIFKIIWQQSERGLSSIFVSSELEELLHVCDRILVMKQGIMVGELDPTQTTLTELYSACMEGF
ncbi:MAG: sugar ABC transporter ATP-binding protein [Oceanospirillaceae bacterium]|nr:sugar ABC transporter ATP-binding protein [Oceanospirillaceae bacterium]